MKTFIAFSALMTLLPFGVIACPSINGAYVCEDLQTSEKTKETFATDTIRKTITIVTEGDATEKYSLDAGKKVLVPAINETINFEDGKILLSATHYSATCLNTQSIKVEFSTTQKALDQNGSLISQESSIATSVIADITSSSFTRSTEGKILGMDYVSTELCTKL